MQGPETLKVPHARLLYTRHFEPEKLWQDWPAHVKNLDRVIEEHPRLNLANTGLYLYFFGPEAKEAWVGREIVGHLARSPEGFATFDSFQSDAFCWQAKAEQLIAVSGQDLLKSAYSLRELAGEALADTWRVALSPLEPWTQDGNIHKDLPSVTFQFYKKD